MAQVCGGDSVAQSVVVRTPPLQLFATVPWHVTPAGEHGTPASAASPPASCEPLPSLPLVSGPKNESGNAMSSVASPMPPLPLPLLLPVVLSPPPLSNEKPLLLPLELPPLVLPLLLAPPLLPPLDEASPVSNTVPPLPEPPQPTAMAAPQPANEAQRSHLRTQYLRGCPRRYPAAWHQRACPSNVKSRLQRNEDATGTYGDSS